MDCLPSLISRVFYCLVELELNKEEYFKLRRGKKSKRNQEVVENAEESTKKAYVSMKMY